MTTSNAPHSKPTIFAPATAAGRAAIAVVRVSGPAATEAIRHLTGRDPPKPRLAALRRISNAGAPIDDGLVLWFPAPRSETGEDMAEFHLHGGRAVVGATLDALASLPGLVPAEPGAFARQAFENGKLDLTAAEAIADLVEAETTAQRLQALRQMGGALAQLYDSWRERMLGFLARLEALIDFPEEDVPREVGTLSHNIEQLLKEITLHLGEGRGERLRWGLSIAILGAPNAGKSSLLNFLARREAAIVSARAGTTRDVIEVHLDIGGYPVALADTAGLRAPLDEIEAEGVRRAQERAARADLKLILMDGQAWPLLDPTSTGLIDDNSLVLVTKADLNRAVPARTSIRGHPAFSVSVVSGEGTAELLHALHCEVKARMSLTEAPAFTRIRHRQALEDCVSCLSRALAAEAAELKAEDLRLAARSLGRITGRVDVEEILDRIFAEFCIGK